MKRKIQTVNLFTEEGEALLSAPEDFIPWNVYPRPHMERDSFLCLNGRWKFGAGGKGEILVPFVPESELSGIGLSMQGKGTLVYSRTFALPEGFEKGRVLLHFGAADQIARVFLNGKRLGKHVGGYDGFSFDITDKLDKENTLEVFVTDTLDRTLPYGKQCEKRGGMWYTPVSGIWQTVWLESVPRRYVRDVRVVTSDGRARFTFEMSEGSEAEGRVVLHGENGDSEFPIKNGRADVAPEDKKLWSPESPYLYRVTAYVGDDCVRSYFALRTLDVREADGFKKLCLNGKPYFFHGLLDQGYFSDGIFTPATPEGYENDILTAKRLGFNMLRKHIKVEPELFYYYCDKHGMAVFQDMVNNSDYSFLRDTALPTAGFKSMNDRLLHRKPAERALFIKGMEKTVKKLSFHPSVVYWTIFNEGWGQFDHASVYEKLRALDKTRFIDSVSGWFTPKKQEALRSDVSSHHVYFKPVKLKKADRPLVLSEFGGYSLKVEHHSFNLVDNYGYRTFKTQGELEDALEALYLGEVLPAIKESGLCAAVYTQLTDVEDETNGLLTYDRRVIKVDEAKMRAIAEKLTGQ